MTSYFNQTWCRLVMCGIALFGLCLLAELIHADWKPGALFAEGPPNISIISLLRSALIFLSASLVSWGLLSLRMPKLDLPKPSTPAVWLSCASATLGVLLASTIWWHPTFFSELIEEDGLIENASAALLFLCAAICLDSGYRAHKRRYHKVTTFSFITLAGLFFLIGMEEVSWFQRVLDIPTPEILSGNLQGELNLHNLNTNKVENLYYLGAFVFVSILPFLRNELRRISILNPFQVLFPSPLILLWATTFSAYNHDMWNISAMQFTFFYTFSALGFIQIQSKVRPLKLAAAYCLICAALIQLQFLFNSPEGVLWAVTEYKEFFIPIAFLAYSVERRCALREVKES